MTGVSLDGVGEVVMRVCEVGVKWEFCGRLPKNVKNQAAGGLIDCRLSACSGALMRVLQIES